VLGSSPTVQARDELLAWGVDQEHGADLTAHLGGKPVKGLGLRDRSGESIEQNPRRRRDVFELGAHHPNRDVVGNVLSALEIRLHATPEVGPPADVIAEYFAGRELHPSVLQSEGLRLGSLPHPRGTHDDEITTGAAGAREVSGGHALCH
jgi:hypothetical protein